MTYPPSSETHSVPSAQEAAVYLHWSGRASFWGQLAMTILASGLLMITLLSRRISADETSAVTGSSIFLAVLSTLVLAASTWLSFRFRRLARQLESPQQPTPSRLQALKQLELGLLVSGIGLAVALLGSLVGSLALLARTMTQPQGAAIYNPTNMIRVLDAMALVIGSGLAIAHTINAGLMLWLVKLTGREV